MKQFRSSIVLFIVVMLLTSCTTTSTPSTPTAIPATATPSPTATVPNATPTTVPSAAITASPKTVAPTGNTGQPAAGSKVDAAPAGILTKTATARGLQANGEVPFTTISKDELRPFLVKKFEKEHGKEELEKSKALLVMFDLIGENDDLYGLYLGLLDEQVQGFYEFDNRTMTLVGGGGAISAKDEIVLAHEYVHALQDQHFNIGARVKQARNDGEKSLALQALIEGDATLAMADYASKNMRPQDLASLQDDAGSLNMQKLSSAPLVLQVSLLFPYQQGANFVASLFRSGGWAAVNNAYTNPPTTSEQIIHPEKYIAGEGARQVTLPDIAPVLSQQWSKLDSGTVGELGWLVYFAKALGTEQAGIAGAGWGGDQYVLFRNGLGKQALATLSEWDTVEDAEEFFVTLYDLQDTQAATVYTTDEDTRFAWSRPSNSGYASIKDKQVLFVITPDEATTKKIVGRFSGF